MKILVSLSALLGLALAQPLVANDSKRLFSDNAGIVLYHRNLPRLTAKSTLPEVAEYVDTFAQETVGAVRANAQRTQQLANDVKNLRNLVPADFSNNYSKLVALLNSPSANAGSSQSTTGKVSVSPTQGIVDISELTALRERVETLATLDYKTMISAMLEQSVATMKTDLLNQLATDAAIVKALSGRVTTLETETTPAKTRLLVQNIYADVAKAANVDARLTKLEDTLAQAKSTKKEGSEPSDAKTN